MDGAGAPVAEPPSRSDLGFLQKVAVAFERLNEGTKEHGASLAADSAARRVEQVSEFQRRKDAGEELNVTERRYLLRNQNAPSDLAKAVGRIVEARLNLSRLPINGALRQFFEAPSVAEAAHLFREHSGEIAGALGIESIPALTVGLITMVALGPVGGAVTLTGTSGLDGYAKGLVGALAREGVDVSQADKLTRALQDKALMERVRTEATKDSAIEAGASALTMWVGGKIGKLLTKGLARTGRTETSKSIDVVPEKPSHAGSTARLRYMGRTPDKFSRTGQKVLGRMRSDGLIVGEGPLVRGNPNDLQFVTKADNGSA